MANSIALASVYLAMLDDIYKQASKTSMFDTSDIKTTEAAATVLLPKLSLQGLGTYGRNTGFVAGDATLTYETKTLSQDRARSFQIDAMDNQETADVAFGKLSGEFIRTKVVPEVDAYRFATLATAAGNTATPATLTKSTIWTAIDTAIETMDEAEVPSEGRILFISPSCYSFLRQSDNFVRNVQVQDGAGINTNIDMYNGMKVVMVPQARFYTAITLYDGTTGGQEAGSFVKGAGKDINFLIVHPTAAMGVVKHVAPRVFAPNVNQNADAWKYDYRIYHDIFVPENKTAGIYCHNKA